MEKSKKEKQKFLLYFSLSLFVLILVEAFLCTPLSAKFNSDILIMETAVPVIWDLFQRLIQFLWFWVAYAFYLFSVARFSWKPSFILLPIYLVASILRSFANLVSGSLMLGWDDFSVECITAGLDVLLNLLQMLLVVGIAYLLFSNHTKTKFLPFEKVFAFGNPLSRAVLYAAILPSLITLLSRVYYDVFVFGAVQNVADLIWMIFYYLCDLLSILIGYCVMILMISFLHSKSVGGEK